MAVLIEAISVVAKVSTIQEKLRGGLQAFADLAGNSTYCCDGELVRVGFMGPPDVEAFVNELARRGLTPHDEHGWCDVAVVDQNTARLTGPCPWLTSGRHSSGIVGAWLSEHKEDPGRLGVPPGWVFEGSLSQRSDSIPAEQMDSRFEYLGRQDGRDVYRERGTGKVKYVSVAFPGKDPSGGRLTN